MHSLGIEPVTMTLLAQCFTFFSEEPRRKVYSSVLFHKWAKSTLNVPSIHLVHYCTSSEDFWCFLWGTHWNLIHTKSLLSHFSGEQIVPHRATVRLQKTWSTYGCLLLYFHGAFLSFLSFADPMHIMEKCTCICVPHLVNDDRTLVSGRAIAFPLVRSVKHRRARVPAKVSAIMHETLKIFPVSTPHVFPALRAWTRGHRRLYVG